MLVAYHRTALRFHHIFPGGVALLPLLFGVLEHAVGEELFEDLTVVDLLLNRTCSQQSETVQRSAVQKLRFVQSDVKAHRSKKTTHFHNYLSVMLLSNMNCYLISESDLSATQ